MTTPVTYGFVGSVFQGHVTAGYGDYSCSQHLHLFYIDMLAFYIGLAHVYNALHIHQGTNRGSGNPMLACTCFSDDTSLPHAACQ